MTADTELTRSMYEATSDDNGYFACKWPICDLMEAVSMSTDGGATLT